jgi:hypothetical protein
MGRFRSEAARAAAVAFLLSGVVGVTHAAQATGAAPPAAPTPAAVDPARPQKSVYGKIEHIDKSQNRLFMKTNDGKRLVWRFDAPIIEEASRFKPGDSVIVIYRQLAQNEKRVTAIAFPGTASSPIYVNLTGSRVVVRSAPMVDGACTQPKDAPAQDASVPSGGLAEVLDACWCCAPDGQTCTPGTKSGLGRAILVQCFE